MHYTPVTHLLHWPVGTSRSILTSKSWTSNRSPSEMTFPPAQSISPPSADFRRALKHMHKTVLCIQIFCIHLAWVLSIPWQLLPGTTTNLHLQDFEIAAFITRYSTGVVCVIFWSKPSEFNWINFPKGHQIYSWIKWKLPINAQSLTSLVKSVTAVSIWYLFWYLILIWASIEGSKDWKQNKTTMNQRKLHLKEGRNQVR